jgi:hypothetical protein
MPYGTVTVQRIDGRIVIIVDPPRVGELSARGRAENLVQPADWIQYVDTEGCLAIKLTVCKPLNQR